MKKLTYILNSYSATESSHFHHVLGLLEELCARGILITLVIEKASSVPSFSNPNITVRPLKYKTGVLRFLELFAVLAGLIRQGYTRTYVRIAAPATLVASVAHRLFGGAVFFWQSGTTLEHDREQPRSMKKLRWYLSTHLPTAAARRFTHYFVTGPASMVDYYADVAGVRRDKIKLLFNDIDTARFAPHPDAAAKKAAFLEQHGFAPDAMLLLLVHRLSPVRKTLLYFPDCLAHLNQAGLLANTVMVVAGAGPELAAVKREAAEKQVGARCIFLGSIPNRDIEQLYALADVFLHPTYNEGFPRVVLEAMAAGLPIVSTDAGGTRELLGAEQQRYVSSRDDPAAFARNLAALVGDGALRARLARENIDHVERFSTQNVAAMYEQVLFA